VVFVRSSVDGLPRMFPGLVPVKPPVARAVFCGSQRSSDRLRWHSMVLGRRVQGLPAVNGCRFSRTLLKQNALQATQQPAENL
jgi:hypothetical protein